MSTSSYIWRAEDWEKVVLWMHCVPRVRNSNNHLELWNFQQDLGDGDLVSYPHQLARGRNPSESELNLLKKKPLEVFEGTLLRII